MNLSDIQDVALKVLFDFRTILCAVFVVLYLNFIYYVIGYRKKPPKAKKKKAVVAAAPAKPAEGDANAEGDGDAAAEETTA